MLRRLARKTVSLSKRSMGSGHGHHEGPHVPVFYNNLGYSMLTLCFFWIMYRAKENKGQLLVGYSSLIDLCNSYYCIIVVNI